MVCLQLSFFFAYDDVCFVNANYLMPTWYIDPVLLKIGPLQVHWYGVMYGIAFLIGYFWLQKSKLGKGLGLTGEQKDVFMLAVIAGVLLGGRLGYILFYNLPYYLSNPLKILAVWEGGMSFHGGFLGVLATMIWFSKKYKVTVLKLGDAITGIAPIGLFFGRIGNFINGELYGRIATDWCLYFPADPKNCRYPSQLLEAFLEGLVLFLVLWIVRKYTHKSGMTIVFFLIFYGIFRSFAEFFREPDAQIGFLPGGITEGQLLSLLMMLGGSILLWHLVKKAKSFD